MLDTGKKKNPESTKEMEIKGPVRVLGQGVPVMQAAQRSVVQVAQAIRAIGFCIDGLFRQ